MKRALLIGDLAAPDSYHPLEEILQPMQMLMADIAELNVCTAYQNLTYEDLTGYNLLLDAADQWSAHGSDRLTGAILAYVAHGGTMLSIHQGIIKGHDLSAVIGGQFRMHPPYTTLEYCADSRHPLLQGHPPLQWTMEEEPYDIDVDAFMEATYFLKYRYGELWKPAGWTRQFGRGTVCYLSPGHHHLTMTHPVYGIIFRQCLTWLLTTSEQKGSLGSFHDGGEI